MDTANSSGPTGVGSTHLVVVNDEEQHSVWEADRELPAGWHTEGFHGSLEECLAHIDTVWTDITPKSVRDRLASGRG